jgi:NADH:ubiquinone oxidoreductase subunit K
MAVELMMNAVNINLSPSRTASHRWKAGLVFIIMWQQGRRGRVWIIIQLYRLKSSINVDERGLMGE